MYPLNYSLYQLLVNMDAQAQRFRLKAQALVSVMALHQQFDFLVSDLALILQQPETPCFHSLGNPKLARRTTGTPPQILANLLILIHVQEPSLKHVRGLLSIRVPQ